MTNLFVPEKYVKGTLVGVDGNAFALMGHFKRLATRQGWYKEDIDKVLDVAKSGDYDNLVVTLDSHMEYSDEN
jgi:hypothetical protein